MTEENPATPIADNDVAAVWLDGKTIRILKAALEPLAKRTSGRTGSVIDVELPVEVIATLYKAVVLARYPDKAKATEPRPGEPRDDAAKQALRRQAGEELPR